MFSRSSWFCGLVLVALVGPYLMLDKHLGANLWSKWQDLTTSTSKKPAAGGETAGGAHGSLAKNRTSTATLASAALCDIPEAFRFDVSPQWVTTRWPRVTTALAETDLQGLRVPLVTGNRLDDLAGSLTYYFDKGHEVQRIVFQGTTGDEQRLVAFLTQTYGLKAVPTLGAGLYMTESRSKPHSTLRVAWPPVISTDNPTSRCEVVLELNRSDASSSHQVRQLLEFDKGANRW